MHWFVVGISGCGKSRLLKTVIIPQWRRRRVPVLVCDPLCKRDWGDIQYQTDNAELLTELARKSKGCVLIVDECEEALRTSPVVERKCKYLATMSRNDGHIGYFSCQRALMLPPSYRNQTSKGYVFQQTAEDADALYRLWNRPELSALPGLPLGTFLMVLPGETTRKIRLF